MKLIRILAVLSLIASPLFAQQGIHISNTDPRWGEKITVGYLAPDTSAFAKPDCKDTLFCAAIVKGVRPEKAIILPMRHVSGASYETELMVPDSTSSLWVEICVPNDRAPNGIESFTCRTRDGRSAPGGIIEIASSNIDSALDADLKEYPKHYTSYVAAYDHGQEMAMSGEKIMPDTAWGPWLRSLITRMKKSPDTTPAWHLALGELYMRQRKDSLANLEFGAAAQSQGIDPIFNDGDFWNHFFAPSMQRGGGMSFPIIPGRLIAPLVERNPRTQLASVWLERMGFDTLLPASSFRLVSDVWAGSEAGGESHDVDVLLGIAQAYGYEKSPLYDPKKALVWCERAERSAESYSCFYSGDNIWGGMGRLSRILACKISLLAKLGRIDEAIAIAHRAMLSAEDLHDKQQIGGALAHAYSEAGRVEDAKRAYGEVLALGTGGHVSFLKEFYEKVKDGNETLAEFSKRLAKTYGGKTELPVVPDFTFKTLDGMSGTLAGLRGKVVVLDCWFISCPGCNIEKASLNKLVESFRGDTNVVFLSIAMDGEKALRHYLEQTPSKFKIVPNGYPICQKIGVTGFPTHIIIGKDGRTLGNEMGGSEHEDEQMRPKILEALGKS